MKDLFDSALVEDIKQRILHLGPESERQWGTMTVAQALAHCTAQINMAMGVITPKRAPFLVNVISLLVKPVFFRIDMPIPRNARSVRELLPADPTQCELGFERTKLITAIDRFVSQGAANHAQNRHPHFGPLRPHEWAVIIYTHVDHHLRQFGV